MMGGCKSLGAVAMPFLYILLGIVLAVLFLLVLLAVGYFWLRRKLRGWQKELKKAIAENPASPPMRITLSPQEELEWSKPERIGEVRAALQAVGYESIAKHELFVGQFVNTEMFMHSEVGSYAVVYELMALERIPFDMLVYLEADDHITFTSNPDDGMDRPPWSQMTRFPEYDPGSQEDLQKMHNELVERIGDRKVKRFDARGLGKKFVEDYAREQDWRMMRGGITPDEVRRIAANDGHHDLTDERVAELRQPWLETISYHVSELIKKKYLKKTKMTGDEWANTEDRLLVVHEMTTTTGLAGELTDMIICFTDADDEDDEVYDKTLEQVQARLAEYDDVRKGFRDAMNMLPEAHRCKKLGSFSKPFPGDIWLGPELHADIEVDEDFE